MAEQNIDKLTIEIEASAKSLDSVFTAIASQLNSIKSALAAIDTSKLEKANTAISKINSTVSKSTSNNKVITPTVNTSDIDKAKSKIETSISTIKSSYAGLTSYANAALSGDSSSFTSFQRRVISINSSIDALKSKLEDVGNTTIPTDKYVQVQQNIADAKNRLSELKEEEQAYASSHTGYQKEAEYQAIVDKIKEATSELQQYKADAKSLKDSGTDTIKFSDTADFSNYKNQLDGLRTKVNSTKDTVTEAYNKINNSTLTLNASDIKSELSNVSTYAKSAASGLWSIAKTGISTGISAVKSSVSGLATALSTVKTAVSKVTSGFSTGLKKILRYGFGIRSTYVLFRRLRTAITDSFTELQKSGAYVEETTSNVNALKTALYTLKYQFGAAFETIFNTVAPALETMINYLVAAMNTISAFIAKLTGASTYSKAVVTMNSVADSAGSASDATEDLNKQLQGFDELNNLSGDSDSGSGGSGSSSSDDYSVTYVEELVENSLTSFWSTLADYIEAGDWYMVGNTIANALTDALNSINWESVWSTVSDWGTNLASFMNGLITEDLFSAIGTTIGNSIKTGLTFLNSFGTTFDWANFGSSIAAGINAYIESNPLSLAVETFNTWANGILTTLCTAVENISWSQLATNIANAIGSLDTSGIMGKLGTLASDIANALYTLVSNKETWSNLGTKIGEGINSFFTSMSTTNGSTGLTGWAALGKTISNSLKGIATTITTALATVDWEEVGQGIADFISNINWADVAFSFNALIAQVKKSIKDLLKGMNIDASDIAIGITGIAVTVLAITAIKLAASITMKVLQDLIASKLSSWIVEKGGLSVALSGIGDVTATIGSVGLVITAAIIGWKMGGIMYESVTGKQYPPMDEILGTIFSDNAFNDLINGIKLDLSSDSTITFDLSKVTSLFTGNLATSHLACEVNRLNITTQKFVVDVDNSKTDSAMTFTNKFTFKGILGSAYDEILEDAGEYGGSINEAIAKKIGETGKDSKTFAPDVNYMHQGIDDAIEDEFEINSPAKTMYKYGSSIVEGIRDGISLNSSESMFSTAISGVKAVLDSLLSAAGLDDVDISISATLATGVSTLKSWGDDFVDNISDKWTDTKATVSAVLGGDIEDNGISTFITWITGIGNLQSAWTGKKATFKADTGGQISTISELGTWQSTFENLYNAWNSKKAEFTAQYGSNTSESIIGKMKQKIGELTSAWYGKDAKFTAGYGGDTNAKKIDGLKSAISGLTGTSGLWHSVNAVFTAGYGQNTSAKTLKDMTDAVSPLVSTWKSPAQATFNASFNQSTSTMQDYADAIKNIHDNWTGASASFTMTADITTSNLNEVASSLATAINNKLKYTSKRIYIEAMGGVLTNSGWSSIPQYANGSLNTGSLFFAGEKAGNPELVGHVNGRTEVLNKSQIAATMYASMNRALSNLGSLVTPTTISPNGYSASGLTGASGMTKTDALMIEQNRLIAEQNALLERIADKDPTIPVSDIFTAMRAESNNYYNRTGNSAFIGF